MIPPFEYYSPVVLFTLARFSRWDDVLEEPAPPAGPPLHHRHLALRARTRLRREGQADSARSERDSVAAIAAKIPPEQMANLNSSRSAAPDRRAPSRGRHRGASGKHRRGRAQRSRDGIAIEDELIYDEPTAWPLPLRQQLGALLPGRRPAEGGGAGVPARIWCATRTTAGRSTDWPRRSARRGGAGGGFRRDPVQEGVGEGGCDAGGGVGSGRPTGTACTPAPARARSPGRRHHRLVVLVEQLEPRVLHRLAAR